MTQPTKRPPPSNTYRQLAETFKALGHSEGVAQRAAAGREGAAVLGRAELREAAKDIAGLSAKAYAYAPDPESPATWKLQIVRSETAGSTWLPDEELVRDAVQKVVAPNQQIVADADLSAVLQVLRSAWIALSLPLTELPSALQQLELANALRSAGGMTMREALAAARGRDERNNGRSW